MANQVKCPHCGKSFEMTEAFKHEIEEELKAKIQEESDAEIEKFKKELEEQKEKNEEFKKEEIKLREEMRDEKRKLEEERKDIDLTIQRKLDKERESAKEEAFREAQNDFHDKVLEKDKKISDMEKLIGELRQKARQGSQQTQGEVVELEIEDILKKEFPNDEIKDVPKGVKGADIIQIVNDKMGSKNGIIIWESKNAKWSEGWIQKLKDDKRLAKADVAVLVSENLPEDIKNFSYRKGVWVTGRKTFVALAQSLRINLHEVFIAKQSTEGLSEKMEILYQYLSSSEFQHKVEAIIDTYTDMQIDIEKEKRWFAAKWAKQEKSIRRVIDNVNGMHGELESVMGEALPPIKNLELTSGEE